MKKLLLCVLCSIAIGAFAQDTLKKTNKVGDFNEEFMVLKANKKMRQGSYKLFYQKALVAEGKYDQGKRAGIWNFYADDKQVQQFDYNANKVISATPENDIKYNINANDGDDVKTPIIAGGLTAGLRFMAAHTNYADNIADITGKMTISHSINLDEDGKITRWTTIIKSADGLKVVNPSFTDVPDELRVFTPAMAGGKKIASVITFKDREAVKEADKDASAETKTMRTVSEKRGRKP